MRTSPIVLLLFALLGCGSGSQSEFGPFEAGIRGAAGNELTQADLDKVTHLSGTNKEISDLTPLARLTNLKTLHLQNNKIADLRPLAELKQLEDLILQDNQITNLSPLAELTNLKRLWLGNNPKLTLAEIEKLQKALPDCEIKHNVTN